MQQFVRAHLILINLGKKQKEEQDKGEAVGKRGCMENMVGKKAREQFIAPGYLLPLTQVLPSPKHTVIPVDSEVPFSNKPQCTQDLL